MIDLAESSLEIAPLLLGAVFRHDSPAGAVAIRITEVEAYIGEGLDPGSHAFRGKTARNAVMYGDPGHLYTYFTYGMHVCANVVCSPPGEATAVLLRGGEVIEGIELARERRTTAKNDAELARGPARLVRALGIAMTDNGAALDREPFSLEFPQARSAGIATSLRTGVSGPGGRDPFRWRFFLEGDPTVSPYKRHPKA
ncbi:DNA-3-methyladenine glycosylase [Herbiconiux ginsengi]|uniref:Putative 3-methyladenine DNA glycosylase n=1 Tax=Herbiconiux ginsengi TaxID=381665 RepID=A0A1H3T3A3_9MICO|nr:DNA-3-methyladenine glycosylase [Herbiconiux ginsengi]SDZ44702.1 DNA-3-methyladenine glycosylase [Herbiconiux ginsengi]